MNLSHWQQQKKRQNDIELYVVRYSVVAITEPMLAISLHYDSEATMSRAIRKVYNDNSRHISLRHEYFRQLIVDEIITIVHVSLSSNLVDPFTKGLG